MTDYFKSEEWALKKKVGGIIDSEYDVLYQMTADDLWDYLESMFPGEITKEFATEMHAIHGFEGR